MSVHRRHSESAAVSPQPQESFRRVLLVSLQSWAPSPASSARSTGLQSGTDAGMSSVLLTMVGSQCGDRNPPRSFASVCESVNKITGGKTKTKQLLWLMQATRLHAKGTGLQKQVYRGRTVLYMVESTRGFLLPSSWPLCLCVELLLPLSVALRKATCDKSFFFSS